MARGDFTRWLYRGQRPNRIARIVNRASAAVASSGVASNYLVTLEVTGRKSGRTSRCPWSWPSSMDSGTWCQCSEITCSGFITYAQPVERPCSGTAAGRRFRSKNYRLASAPILKAYLQRAAGARPHVPVNKDAALSEFEKIAAAIPVFRVLSAG